MTQMTTREALKLVITATGVLSLLVGAIWAFVLLTARTERGVVKLEPMLEHGETTNAAYAVFAGGRHLRLRVDDSRTPLKPGDTVTVLHYGKGGTLKFGHSFWSEWRLVGTLIGTGAAFVISGLYANRRSTVTPINATQLA
jgi:hypothetical protein